MFAVVVTDTGFWLKAKDPLDTFPYREFVTSPDFAIAVPFPVFEELDEKAKEGATKAIKRRARQVIRSLTEATEASPSGRGRTEGELASGLTVWLLGPDDAQSGQVSDARIVNAAHELQASVDELQLLTADGGMLLRARPRGIKCTLLSDEHMEPDNDDRTEKQLSDLQNRLAKLEGAKELRLDCQCQWIHPDSPPHQLTRVPPLDSATVEKLRGEIHAALGVVAKPGDYANTLREYADRQVLPYLVRRAHHEREQWAVARIRFLITNRGSQGVDSPVLIVTAPKNVTFLEDDVPTEEDPPAPPRRPSSFSIYAAPVSPYLGGRLLYQPPYVPGRTAPKIEVSKHEVRMELTTPLRPDYPTTIGDVWMHVTDHSVPGIELTYRVHASDGRPHSGTFTVPIQWRDEQWSTPPLPRAGDDTWRPGPAMDRRREYKEVHRSRDSGG